MKERRVAGKKGQGEGREDDSDGQLEQGRQLAEAVPSYHYTLLLYRAFNISWQSQYRFEFLFSSYFIFLIGNC